MHALIILITTGGLVAAVVGLVAVLRRAT